MSHVATIDLKIMDLDALEAAAKTCGLELRRGQKTYEWFGRWVKDYHAHDAAYKNGFDPNDYGKCDHAIINPTGGHGAYEIGVVARDDGSYALIYDFWGTSGRVLKDKVGGNNCEGLAQEYSVNVATKQAKKQGLKVKRTMLEDGSIKLTCVQQTYGATGW